MDDNKIKPEITIILRPKFWEERLRNVKKGDDTPWDCPKCNSKLAIRINVDENHPNYGDIFLGCSAWFTMQCDFTRIITYAELDEVMIYKEKTNPDLQLSMFD